MENLIFSRLDFPEDEALKEELRDAYLHEKVQEVYTLGARRGLSQRQPKASLEALVYLMAECYFRETMGRWNSRSRIPADFPAAIDHYEQAIRYAPDSPLRPLGDYRLSQIYGLLGGDDRLKSQILLQKLVANKSLPAIQSSNLYELGANVSLKLHEEHPTIVEHLDIAQKALDEFLRQFPGDEHTPLVLFLLGEIQYRRGNYARALELMETATAANPRGRGMVVPVAMRGHMALAAQHTSATLVNLVNPSTRLDNTFRGYLEDCNDMDILMEYAKLLADAGNRKDAIRIYNRVAEMGKPKEPIQVRRDPLLPIISEPKVEQTTTQRDKVYAARLAITRYALRDLQQTGKLAPDVPYEDYQEPIKAIDNLLQNVYRIGQESELLREKALHLLALGKTDPARNAEALEMILPLLQPGKLPATYAKELRDTVWNIIPEVMAGYHQNGEDWLALRAFMTFRDFLKDHPRRKEILLTCARIFLDANLRQHASEVLDEMGPLEQLTPEEQEGVNHLRRELLLDPKNPESLKTNAPALLGPGYDDATKARVLTLLGRVYADENQHAYAAQVYLQGASLQGLPWKDRIEFYARAAREYENALMYDKAFTMHLASIRALEEAGVATAAAEEWIGNALMGMGENAQRIQDYNKAAKSYEQYLNTYPNGENAEPARYQLGKVYEALGEKAKAIEQYDTLSKTGKAESFWTRMAKQSADILRLQDGAGAAPSKKN
jgi:tetratricopeptide (TPR) repeat protein